MVPHAPQFPVSLETSTHEPPQLVVPAAQLDVHVPPPQTWFWPHAAPHAPQFARSLERLVHAPSHGEKPPLHATPQLPALHVADPFAGTRHT